MGSNTEKKAMNLSPKLIRNWSKEIKSDNFKSDNFMGSNREKFNIAIAILEKLPFIKGNKNYFVFW